MSPGEERSLACFHMRDSKSRRVNDLGSLAGPLLSSDIFHVSLCAAIKDRPVHLLSSQRSPRNRMRSTKAPRLLQSRGPDYVSTHLETGLCLASALRIISHLRSNFVLNSVARGGTGRKAHRGMNRRLAESLSERFEEHLGEITIRDERCT